MSPDLEPRKIDCTIRLARGVVRMPYKKRAPRAVRDLKAFAQKMMGTPDVRIESKLNEVIWSKGIRKLPRRVRVRLSRKRTTSEKTGEEATYTLVEFVECANFKGLATEAVIG